MLVHRDLNSLPVFKNAVVTIGTFDGVHLGHQQVIRQLREEALLCNGESVIITFEPHPRLVLNNRKAPISLLTTLEEKIYLLSKQEIDHLVVVPFTRAFSEQTAADYISGFLVDLFHPHTIIIGYDHRFGHNREGDFSMLQNIGIQYHFKAREIPRQVLHHITVSSTGIRKHLLNGEIAEANELAGYPYMLSGEVIHGDKRGRTLGFPTANLAIPVREKLIPADGVYAVKVTIPSPVGEDNSSMEVFDAALNIGKLPTFDGHEQRIEAFIFDFDRDIYNRKIMISFYDFIREDIKFPDVASLVRQMTKDVRRIRTFFNGASS